MVSVLLCLICTVKAYLVLVYALNSKQGIIMSLGILTVGSAGTVVKTICDGLSYIWDNNALYLYFLF